MASSLLQDHWHSLESSVAAACDRFGFDWSCFRTSLTKHQDEALQQVMTVSQFVADSFPKDAEYLAQSIRSNTIAQHLTKEMLSTRLLELGAEAQSEDDWHRALRILRRRTMVQIIWCDLLRIADTEQTTAAVSALADVCVLASQAFLTRLLEQRYGKPLGKESGTHQSLLVLGMGKLGGHELNLSSDIDLIFFYPENGETDGPKTLSNQEFFTKLGQKLVTALDRQTLDGFVFRTDMRLRPYGESGPLVMSFAALEDYLQTQGRDWERFAMIKARVLNGETSEPARQLLALLRPFSFRQYLDYSAVESLREMKAMINAEVRRRQLTNNIKLGAGGIREIEFIGQAFQLIRGGQEPELQQRQLVPLLKQLSNKGYIPENACDELIEAYRFLRDSEHALQALNDAQTQTLPDSDVEQQRFAMAMLPRVLAASATPDIQITPAPDATNQTNPWEQYTELLERYRTTVSHHFAQLIRTKEQGSPVPERCPTWQHLWLGMLDEEDCQSLQGGHPELCQPEFKALLEQFRESRALASLQSVAYERIHQLMPDLLAEVGQTQSPLVTLQRLIPLLETILRRSAYLLLLKENPKALRQLVQLCYASPWMAEYICDTPILLDELLEQASLKPLPARRELAEQLRVRMLRVEPDDLEQQMEQLRQFVRSHIFQAAACDMMKTHPLMLVSGYLTSVAEVCLGFVMQLAWDQMVQKYGYPSSRSGDSVTAPEFLVIGYGKVGGKEMSYSSDLDLVFLHDGWNMGSTLADREQGQRSIDNPVFYTRMGQRMIHIMSTRTRSGELYEVDMRLRPSGNSGMIVASLKAFEEYQQKHAWTWEHQALVRARDLCGHPGMAASFNQIRQQILGQPRELEALKQEVSQMRLKMRAHLGSGSVSDASQHPPETGQETRMEQNSVTAADEITEDSFIGQSFQLKQDAGGIVDIEFLVQYGVLAWAHKFPALMKATDNIRLLEALTAAGLLDSKDRQTLQDSYLSYRAETHRRALQLRSMTLTAHESRAIGFDMRRYNVARIWQQWMT